MRCSRGIPKYRVDFGPANIGRRCCIVQQTLPGPTHRRSSGRSDRLLCQLVVPVGTSSAGIVLLRPMRLGREEAAPLLNAAGRNSPLREE
jgi:hypothetical protein